MKNIYWLFFLILLVGCEKVDEINFESVLGEYVEVDGSAHYSNLQLRDDSTYYFNHSIGYSCEVWGHYYGSWKLDENKIILVEGINLDSMITVKGQRNEKGDILKINFEKELLEAFPNLTVRFGFEKIDYKPKNNQIIFDKYSFLSRNQFLDSFEKNENGEIIYDYFPLEIHLRGGNFYKIINHFLGYKKLEIGLKDFKHDFSSPKILLEYKLKDGVLISDGLENRIYDHELISGEK